MILRRRKFNTVVKLGLIAGFVFMLAIIIFSSGNAPSTEKLSNLAIKFQADALWGEVLNPQELAYTQPIIERPNQDRLRLLEAMHRDAEEEERERQQEEVERIQLEAERIRRVQNQARPPFKDLKLGNYGSSNAVSNKSTDLIIDKLVNEGLIVPRWNFEPEKPVGDFKEADVSSAAYKVFLVKTNKFHQLP